MEINGNQWEFMGCNGDTTEWNSSENGKTPGKPMETHIIIHMVDNGSILYNCTMGLQWIFGKLMWGSSPTQAMYDHCYGMNGDSQPTNHHGNFHGNRTTEKFHDITRGTVSWKPDRIFFGIFPKSGTKQRGIEIGIYPFFVSETWAPKISKNTITQRETDEMNQWIWVAPPWITQKNPASEKVELKNLTTQWLIIWGYCFSCRFTWICGINPDFWTGRQIPFAPPENHQEGDVVQNIPIKNRL